MAATRMSRSPKTPFRARYRLTARTSFGSEQHAFVASQTHKVPTCGLRFFNVFGPRQDPSSPYSGVISIFCDRLSTARGITIFGDGQQVRDFVFVGDVVRALILAMKNVSLDAKVFNVCTGRGTTVVALAQTIQDVLEISVDPSYAPARAGEVRRSIGNPQAARLGLGFEAAVDLRTGLQALLAEHRGVGSKNGSFLRVESNTFAAA